MIKKINKVVVPCEDREIELTVKQDQFCFQYSLTQNAKQVYQKVFCCKDNSASVESSKLLKKQDIQEVILYYQGKIAESIEKQRNKALIRLNNIAYADPINLFDEKSNTYKVLKNIPEELRLSIEIKTKIDKKTMLLEATDINFGNKGHSQECFNSILEFHKIIDKSNKETLSGTDIFNIQECIEDMTKYEKND